MDKIILLIREIRIFLNDKEHSFLKHIIVLLVLLVFCVPLGTILKDMFANPSTKNITGSNVVDTGGGNIYGNVIQTLNYQQKNLNKVRPFLSPPIVGSGKQGNSYVMVYEIGYYSVGNKSKSTRFDIKDSRCKFIAGTTTQTLYNSEFTLFYGQEIECVSDKEIIRESLKIEPIIDVTSDYIG